jgi:hypothetical protein
LAGYAEWHALANYQPRTVAPGRDVALKLELRVMRNSSANCDETDPSRYFRFVNYVRVHYGEAPLPKFAGGWAYGDLHYHAQGTDNEGESGYNYRGVSQAMKAIGLDFIWATEHASASEQIMDVDISGKGLLCSSGVEARVKAGVLRDMDVRRFSAMKGLADSTNALSIQQASGGFRYTPATVPQVFVGGEVDVIPESNTTAIERLDELCGGLQEKLEKCSNVCFTCRPKPGPFPNSPPEVECVRDPAIFRCCDANVVGTTTCKSDQLLKFEPSTGDYLIQDVQGLNDFKFGREHLIYLPDPSFRDGFVASNTSTYGGATRRIWDWLDPQPGILPEITLKNGVAFLAHHLNTPGGGGPGPEGVPWPKSMLNKAWSSPAVLGLEFWNESVRRRSSIRKGESLSPGQSRIGREFGYYRDSSGCSQDLQLVNRSYAGLLPSRGTNFLFELMPFDVETGMYEQTTSETETSLAKGSYSWDSLNLKGLDPAQTQALSWLPRGEPRKMFIAAGSDAHGDLNYRREGYMRATTAVTDMALGTPRNLVQVGAAGLIDSNRGQAFSPGRSERRFERGE